MLPDLGEDPCGGNAENGLQGWEAGSHQVCGSKPDVLLVWREKEPRNQRGGVGGAWYCGQCP